MSNTLVLFKYFGRTIMREKSIMFLIIFLPVMLVFAGATSAPDREMPLVLDDQVINPPVSAAELSVALYAVTAVVLVASIVSFYLGFNLKHLNARLKQVNYKTVEINLSFIMVMFAINLIMTTAISLFSLLWVTVNEFEGYFIGLFLASVIFSTLGLIIAELVDTTTLGLYAILALGVLDTAFLENPVYSRRYNESWTSAMPSHEAIQMVLRTVYDTGTYWSDNVGFIVIYELILIFSYLAISKYSIGMKSANLS